MDSATPSLVVFITGHLPGIIGVAAILTWPISLGLLAFYRRAVRRSMGQRSSADPDTRRNGRGRDPQAVASSPAVAIIAAPPDAAGTGTLIRELLDRPRRAAWLYACATVAYAVVLTLVTTPFVEPGAPFRPVRFLLLTTMFAAPLVPILAIVAGSSRRRRLEIAGVYAIVYLALVMVATWLSPEFSVGQGLLLWGLYNLPAVALSALCLGRRIRAVGPLVFLFLTMGLIGTDTLALLMGASESSLWRAVTVGGWLGLGGYGTFAAILAFGFVVMAIVGAILLAWIRRRYEAKRMSDESLTVDTVLWLYVFGAAIGLAFEHPLAPLGGVVAVMAFKAVTRIGRAYVSVGSGPGVKLLLLRSFSIGARGERLFEALEKHWRRAGSIHMIAGYDLATRTLEPHEFLDFVTGKLSRRFIDGDDALARRLSEMDTRPDRDGRFRVNDFFCYQDTWRTVLLSLVSQSDAVLMDLRGFSRRNAGCVFEIGELFKLVSLERVLFIVDASTDAAFLDETFARAAEAAGRTAVPDSRRPRLFTCESLGSRSLTDMLKALATAARPAAVAPR